MKTLDKKNDGSVAVLLQQSTNNSSTLLPQQKISHQLWSDSFLSNWFFVWVYPIVGEGWRGVKNVTDLHFRLRLQETARVNVDDLEQAYKSQILKDGYTY